MAYNEIEKRFLGVMAERDFPTLPSEPAVEPKAASQAEMKPTPKNPVLGGVADFVYKVRDLANQYEMKDWVPLIGNMGVGDLLVGKAPEEIEEWAYGNSPVRINPYAGQTASFVPEIKPRRQEQLADALMLGADVLPVAGAAKGAKKIIKATENLPVGASIKPISSAPVTDLGFYSAVEDAALNVQRKSGSGQAFLNDITKGSNVTKDEIKWIGLDDFLQSKKNVTRDEVQQYIAQNKVDIQEVTLDSSKTVEREKLKEASHQALQRVDEMIPGLSSLDRANLTTFWAPSAQAGNASDLATIRALNLSEDQMQAVMEYGAAVNRQRDFIESANGYMAQPKYGRYTLPGGENYREILLTMPEREPNDLNALAQKMYGKNFSELDDAEANRVATADKQQPTNFKSSHWDQKNVLAHIRVNDRVDADGKKMLLIEEVQSDWHQAGRDKGYKSDLKPITSLNDPNVKVESGTNGDTIISYKGEFVQGWASGKASEADMLADLNEFVQARYGRSVVPDAPMKDTWYQLALKRVLKYAADNGYERVGLTTGARQAERFDLSKQVDEIDIPMVNSDGSRSVRIDPIEGTSIKLMVDANGIVTGFGPSSNQFSGKKLNEVVGKEMAEKIMAADKETKFTGLDLSVGGEGMKKYYDEIYPQFLAKYGKKWGAKVGETQLEGTTSKDELAAKVYGRGETYRNLPSESKRKIDQMFMERGEPVRYIDITPEMRESVKKGQPMFVAAPVATGAGSATMQGQEEQ